MHVKTREQEHIDAALLFMRQAAVAISQRRFEDYFDLVDSFDLEVDWLDDMSVEGGCEYWSEHAREFSTLYYLHAMNFFYSALIKVIRKEADAQTLSDAEGMIWLMLEQAELFAEQIKDVTKDDLLFFREIHAKLSNYLTEIYKQYYTVQ